MIAMSVNIGGSNLRVAAFGPEGPIGAVKVKTPIQGDQDAIPKLVESLALELLGKNSQAAGSVVHLGISVAGFRRNQFHQNRFFASNICRLKLPNGELANDWDSLDFGRLSKDFFSSVSIANDVSAEAAAEFRWGATRNAPDSIYVNWGTGVGMGIVSGGRLLLGKNGNASHGGHQFVGSTVEQSLCGCGRVGDIESVAGGRFMELAWGSDISSLFDAYKGGHESAQNIVQNAASTLMLGVTNLCISLDSSVLCFGGGLFLNHSDVLMPIIRNDLLSLPPFFVDGIEIKESKLPTSIAQLSGLAVIPRGVFPWLDDETYDPLNCW